MENSPDEGELPGGVPLGSSKLEGSLHPDRSTRIAWCPPLWAVAVGLVEVGLVQHASLWYAVLPDERHAGPKGSGARLGEADEAPPGRRAAEEQ